MPPTRMGLFLLFIIPLTVHPQGNDSLAFSIPPIIVTAPRIQSISRNAPFALSVLSSSDVNKALPQLSPAEFLSMVPGVFVMNPDNFAQDVRISIRGFGARSSFGIRGVKLLVDGFPVSTPDGQAEVDDVDIGSIARVEVMRGPSSGLYGNAAGGVISIVTEDVTVPLLLEARGSGGMFGYGQFQAAGGQDIGTFRYLLRVSRSQTDGYRAHSGMRGTILNAHARLLPDSMSSVLLLISHVDSPQADDPGALTAEQVVAGRRQAQGSNLLYNAGEAVRQSRFGARYSKRFSARDAIRVSAFVALRDFSNRLPFQQGGMVSFDRVHSGVSLLYDNSGTAGDRPYSLVLGTDIENQRDHRQQRDNLRGSAGPLVLDQREEFLSAGFFADAYWTLCSRVTLSAGLRYDAFRVRLTDSFLSDGDNSGRRTLHAWSPVAGIVYGCTDVTTVYGTVATGFESPALIEFSNNPSGTGGFNPDIGPQRSTSFEAGVRGLIVPRIGYDISLFAIDVRNELTPYELPGTPGRTYYRNAGRSRRLGLELGSSCFIGEGVSLRLGYTFSDFSYRTYQVGPRSYDGRAIPGIPKHSVTAELSYADAAGMFVAAGLRGYDGFFADDANSVTERGVVIANARASRTLHLGAWRIEPFIAVSNLFDARFDSNVRINATGGRYFEPGAGIAVSGGVSVMTGD